MIFIHPDWSILTNTTGWTDFSLSHLNKVIQRSGEHTPNAVNMQTYGVHKYFTLQDRKRTETSGQTESFVFFL